MSMRRKKTSEDARRAFQEMFNALLPPIEDLDDAEVTDLLQSSGINPEALIAKTHEHLQRLAGTRYLSRGESVPPKLRDALHQLKPANIAEQVAIESNKARSAIRSIFERVKEEITGTAVVVVPRAAMQPAFRNKKDLTDADQELLAELQEELDSNDDPSRRNPRDFE